MGLDASLPLVSAGRQPALRGSLDTAYWVFLGIYASISGFWMLMAVLSLVWRDLIPHAMQMHQGTGLATHGEDVVLGCGTLALGLFLAWLAPTNRTARAFAVGLVGTAVGFSLTAHHLLSAVAPQTMGHFSGSPAEWLHFVFHVIAGAAYTYALLLFPDGRLPVMSPKWVFVMGSGLTLALGSLLWVGREPSLFILYCGIAVVVAGATTQWYKARHAETPEDRARSLGFFRSFLIAIGVALAFAAAVLLLQRLDSGSGTDQWNSLVFVAVPPLLAAVGLVVIIGLLQYRMWGVETIRHRGVLSQVLVLGVMGLYVFVEVTIHTLIDQLGARWGIGVSLSIAIGVVACVVFLERPSEIVREKCNRLVHGTPVDPGQLLAELRSDLDLGASPDAVAVSLGSILRRGLGITAGTLTVDVDGSRRMSFSWPRSVGATIEGHEIALMHRGRYLGELVVQSDGRSLTPAEDHMIADLGCHAATALRARFSDGEGATRDLLVSRQGAEHVPDEQGDDR
jgi:hypothetical protein